MLYGKEDHDQKENAAVPLLASQREYKGLPKLKLPKASVEPRIAYRMVSDELLDEGQQRQNLATFCQTFMEDEALSLMSDTMAKNAIDKSEYPRTADIESRCIHMIADLWNVPKNSRYLGTSTIGSSEACMLAGMAMKFRWRKQAEKQGLDINKKPNLVISSGYQVCWEKFCVYWDIELRTVPMNKDCLKLDIALLDHYVDDYTIGIVGILGITYTGAYDDIAALDAWVEQYNNVHQRQLPIHVDAASGGFYTPFVEPDLLWDFRLKNVISINSSGHKYGLVYPGIGWVLWKEEKYLPKELIFKVSYLGGEIPTININFSRSASQVIGQYYNFVRFGFDGYKEIHKNSHHVAQLLSKMLEKTGLFHLINRGDEMPVICYELKADAEIPWTLYDLSDRLQMKGWQVPTYPMPADLETHIIQRIVVRSDFTHNLAQEFIQDFHEAIDFLNHARVLGDKTQQSGNQGFTH